MEDIRYPEEVKNDALERVLLLKIGVVCIDCGSPIHSRPLLNLNHRMCSKCKEGHVLLSLGKNQNR